MKTTPSSLIRSTGLAAMVAGIIFAGIQPIHPADALSSVNTDIWTIIMPLKTAMSLLFVVGITGIYARQLKESGWLGLAGFLLFGLSWALQTCFIFAEAFILPPLAATAPKFVEGILAALAGGQASEVNLGALPAIYGLVGVLYILGGLVFGIATLRAGVLPRWTAWFLIVAAILTPAASVIPHPLNRAFAVPMGLAMACLGYALWSERRERAAEPVPLRESPQFPRAVGE